MAEETEYEFVDPGDAPAGGEAGAAEEGVGEQVTEPPEAWEPPPGLSFQVRRNAFGPGAHSVLMPDGTPVGVRVARENLTGEQVRDVLTKEGLDADLVDFFARNRDGAIAAEKELAADPVVAAFAAEEDRRMTDKAEIQQAFLAAWKKSKEKK